MISKKRLPQNYFFCGSLFFRFKVPYGDNVKLFEKGLDKILKKVGEECSETIIAAKNGDNKETVLEISDLIYHLFVMMVEEGISVDDVMNELSKRSQKTGNLKTFHQVDKNT